MEHRSSTQTLLRGILFTSFLIAFIPAKLPAQDKIITINNDTINCRISRVSRSAIYFSLPGKGIKTSCMIALKSVADYNIARINKPETEELSEIPAKRETGPYRRISFELAYGPGSVMANTAESVTGLSALGFTKKQAESFFSNLGTGMTASAGTDLYILPNFGAGFRYKFFNSGSAVSNVYTNNSTIYYYDYSEKIYVNYAALNIFFDQPAGSRKRLRFRTAVSGGITAFRNETGYTTKYLLLRGRSFGADLGLSAEYRPVEQIGVFAEATAFISSLKKLKVTDGTETQSIKLGKENSEKLSRMDLAAGLRFYFLKR